VLGYYPPAKYVSSIIDIYTEEDDSLTYFSNEIPKAFSNYLNENKEDFFNIGGDNIYSHLESQEISVSKVEINEIWRIIGEDLHYTTQGIVVHINGQPMNEISFDRIKNMDLFIDEYKISDVIESRNFNYIITKVNSQEIKRQDSYNYQRSLIAKKWDNVIEQSLNY
jgi:light-regulated signal transduction histidine kinase (bacteriophytochrome)